MTLFGMEPVTIAPGAVHLPGWLSPQRQRDLADRCRTWSQNPAGLRQVTMPGGAVMSARQVCLGWHWSPYRYSRRTPDGHAVRPFPAWLGELARACLSDATGTAGDYAPDVAVVNFYDTSARMGMHQDNEEIAQAPVVSISLGDTAVFRLGNVDNRNRPWRDVQLASGDGFVFGGPARRAFHGVTKVLPGTGPDEIGVASGRWNITVRQTGFTEGGLSGDPPRVDAPNRPCDRV